MNATMRIPCSRCGQLNNVERAAEVSFRCTACGSANTVRTLASSATSPAQEPRRAPRRWQPALAPRTVGTRVATAAAPAERKSSLGRAKQILVALMVLATAGVLIHPGGTFATFNAQTANAANITTGVLLLGDKVANGTVTSECFSSGGAAPGNPQIVSSGNSSNCASVWTVAAPNKPGDTFLAHVAIRNPGNIAASILQIEATTANTCDSAPGVVDGAITYKGSNQAGLTSTLSGATAIGATSFTLASAANFTIGEFIQVDIGTNFENLTISNIVGNVLTTNAAAKAHANGVAVAGSGLCRQVQLVIAKTDSLYTTMSTCLYGNTGAGTTPFTGCVYDSAHDLRDFNDNDVVAGTPGPIAVAGGIAAGATAYFVIAINFPNSAGSDNGFTGLGAATTFNFYAQQ